MYVLTHYFPHCVCFEHYIHQISYISMLFSSYLFAFLYFVYSSKLFYILMVGKFPLFKLAIVVGNGNISFVYTAFAFLLRQIYKYFFGLFDMISYSDINSLQVA